MPKHKTTRQLQLPTLRREIPQMPEGYYSSGPNPNLCRFNMEHFKPTKSRVLDNWIMLEIYWVGIIGSDISYSCIR